MAIPAITFEDLPGRPIEDPFFQVPRVPCATSTGPCYLPMLFLDVAVIQISYWVDLEKMIPLLAGTGLTPCKFFNGKGLVTLLFFQYKDVSIGGYDEVVINLMVRPTDSPAEANYLPNLFRKNADHWNHMAGYVLEMPVTSVEARAAGRELWGYPKFVTRIPFKLDGKRFEFSVLDPDTQRPLLSVQGRQGMCLPTPGGDYVTYTNFKDQLVRTVTRVNATMQTSFSGDVSLQVDAGEHRLARNVRQLGLAHKKPFLIQQCAHSKTRLEPGLAISAWPTPPLAYPVAD